MTLRTVGAGTSITTGTASQQSIPISGKSTAIRVVATGQNTHVAIGTDPTAAVTDFVVPKDSAATLAFSNTSSTKLSLDRILLTKPMLSASSASIILPVKHISIDFDLPINLVSLCVPPAPGLTPRLILVRKFLGKLLQIFQ